MIWSPGLRPGTGNAAIVLFRVVAFSPAFSVYAAAPLDAQQAMDLITNTADRICNVVSTKGDAESSEAKGEVKAALSGLAAKLADVGVSSSGSINSDQYQNVLRQDLASTLKNNAECKLKVFDTLQAKLLSSDPARTSAGVEAKPPGQLCSDRAGYPVGRWAIITKSRSSGEFSEFITFTRPNGGTWLPTTGQGNFEAIPQPSPGVEVVLRLRPESGNYSSTNKLVVSTDGCRMSGTFADSEGHSGEATYVYQGQ